jgi:sec-independent protein translocase protein TatC
MWKFVLHKMFKMREKFAVDLGTGDAEKPFIEHLDDLRTMIVRIVITLLVATIGTFVFYKELISLIVQPLMWANVAPTEKAAMDLLISTDPTGPFMTAMNVALIAAIIVAFPFLLLFLLQFILPGLKDNEKKLIFPAIAIGAGLFLTGVGFSYYIVLPKALEFFWQFGADMGVKPMWTLNLYITFATRFVLIFGISFELPILVMALVKLDILNYKLMKGTRAHAIVAIAIFAAIITPTQDALTMLMMIAPLYFLYEICIWLAYSMDKKDREMYPEYYKELDKDEAELAKEGEAEWDNDDYNPWSTADDDDDEETAKRKAAESSTTDEAKPAEEKQESEKTLEDYSREDEKRNTD